jgi:hypothetical protein
MPDFLIIHLASETCDPKHLASSKVPPRCLLTWVGSESRRNQQFLKHPLHTLVITAQR